MRQKIEELTLEGKYNEACTYFMEIRNAKGKRIAPFLYSEIAHTLILMKQKKVSPINIDAWNCLINLSAIDEGVEEALATLDIMHSMGYQPNSNTYTILVDVFVDTEKIHLITNLNFKMKGLNVNIESSTFNSLIEEYFIENQYEMAIELFQLMESQNVPPNDLLASIVHKYYGHDPNHRVNRKFKEFAKRTNAVLSEEIVEYIDELKNDFYSHLPEPNFTEQGRPIVPKSFLNYADNIHAIPPNGVFPWKTQGNTKNYPPKQWGKPTIKTVEELKKWMEENKDTEVDIPSTLVMVDVAAIKQEISDRFGVPELMENLKREEQELAAKQDAKEYQKAMREKYEAREKDPTKMAGYDLLKKENFVDLDKLVEGEEDLDVPYGGEAEDGFESPGPLPLPDDWKDLPPEEMKKRADHREQLRNILKHGTPDLPDDFDEETYGLVAIEEIKKKAEAKEMEDRGRMEELSRETIIATMRLWAQHQKYDD
eukprot:TRINITY_DN5892_c0_g1_i1.p1 TRINITY_DN5892_c0_g1~~TRINITY_DN5892_c0_g1_i1.p1  ORF type:complete len:499 (-),score=178.85 TRINITY_DN5892_c0_g1_i1:83-1534(-)